MPKHGFSRSKYDYCVYLQKLNGDDYIYLLLYVDDMFIASESKMKINRLKALVGEKFEKKDISVA